MRQIGGAAGPSPPPISMPCSHSILPLDRRSVDSVGHPDGRQRGELMLGIGEQLKPGAGQPRL